MPNYNNNKIGYYYMKIKYYVYYGIFVRYIYIQQMS